MPKPGNFHGFFWAEPQTLIPRKFVCGYCGSSVSSEKGYKICQSGQTHQAKANQVGGVFICPECNAPTYFPPKEQRQIPGSLFGNDVSHVPDGLNTLYNEARNCVSNGDNTASVLVCRKMLMNIAVEQGAKHNLKFIEYVDYLSDKGYVPPHGKHWVDHIRKKGNEANHEITLMTDKDAKDLIVFLEMLLKFIYEFPNLMQQEPST